MAHGSLIDGQLSNTFKILKDLAKPMTFTKNTSANFNFGSGELSEVDAAPVTFKVVSIESNKPSRDRKVVKKTILARSKDIGDLNLYDKFNFEGFDWKLDRVIKEAGRIWMFDIVREA